MKQILIVFQLCVIIVGFGQKNSSFTGKLVYAIHLIDSVGEKEIPVGYMTIYTNDTMLRIENETPQLGLQVLIKHMVLNKSYLLLQTPRGNYAIQTDHALEKATPNAYVYKKRWGRKRIAGLSSSALMVCDTNTKEKLQFYHCKKINNKYLNLSNSYPGLLTEYKVKTKSGVFKYHLMTIENLIPNKDLFGVPSSYKKTSFDNFINEVMGNNLN